MKVVFDAGVVFSGAGWRGEAQLCLVALARRRLMAYATVETLDELRRVVDEIGFKSRHAPFTILEWYYSSVRVVDPMPLGRQRSRDAKDDPYIACALSARASALVTRDEDLLILERPFGVETITPRVLLARLAAQ